MSYNRIDSLGQEESYPLRTLPSSSRLLTGPAESFKPDRRRTMSNPNRGKLGKVFSYIGDWGLCIILDVGFFMLDRVPGFKREFSLHDTSLRHTFAVHERVPDWALYTIFAGAPLALFPIINLLTLRNSQRTFWWDLHSSVLGWLLSVSITGVVTQFSKITVGRPRPDLIDRCQPVAGAADPSLGLSTVAICTQTDVGILRDGFRSFPSGHSSLSFAGLGFLSFYLMGKLHLFDRRGHTIKAWIALVPLSGAALVAISRTMDYRHHWQDVLTGSILGLVTAYFSYRQYYPLLTDKLSHIPYPSRSKRGGHIPMLPLHSDQPGGAYWDGPHEGTTIHGLGAHQDGTTLREIGTRQDATSIH